MGGVILDFSFRCRNSNIVLGVYDDNDQLAFHWRMVTDLHKTEDEYAMQVLSFLIMQAFHLNK